MTPHVAAIINPRSDDGRTGRAWRLISDALTAELGPVRAHFTTSPATFHYLPAGELARRALKDGAQLIIAVGGDATINEVVNGFFENGAQINPEAHLAIIPTGKRNSVARRFGIAPEMEKNIAGITRGTARQISLGVAVWADETHLYFVDGARFESAEAGLLKAVTLLVRRPHIKFDCSGKQQNVGMREASIRIGEDAFATPIGKASTISASGDAPTRLLLDNEKSGPLPARFEFIAKALTLRC